MRLRSTIVAIAFAVLAGATAGAHAGAAGPEVGCDRIVLRARSGAEDDFRILLGVVSVPGGRHLAGSAVPSPIRGWPYYRNAGLAVRAGASDVTVSVPEGWRDRVAVSWGARPPSATVRFARCEGAVARSWNAYSGGIHLRRAGECVPLIVHVGGMSTTVRVGVGRACGAPAQR